MFPRWRRLDAEKIQRTLEWIGERMATSDDVQTLKNDLDAIKAGVAAQADRISALTQQLATANVNSGVDLSGLVEEANDIAASLNAAAGTSTAAPATDTTTTDTPAA